MKQLKVKNWERFQHYKKRSPPWIKLHRELLNDYAFMSLPDDAKAHLLLIWIVAAGSDGTIPADEKFIASRIGATAKLNIHALLASGFLIEETVDADGVISSTIPGGNGKDHSPESNERAERRMAARRILEFLNEKTGKKFREVDANIDPIMARLQEFNETMLRSIIIHRAQLWGTDETMQEYLRPATLFNKTKCAQYAGELDE